MKRSRSVLAAVVGLVMLSGGVAHAQLIDTAPQPDAVALTGCNRGVSVHVTTSRSVYFTSLDAEINPTAPTNVRFAIWDVSTGEVVLYTDPVAVVPGRQLVSSGDITFSTTVGGDYQIAAMVEGCASWYIDTLTTENENGIETRADGGIQTTYDDPNEPPEDGLTIDARIRINGFLFDDLDGDGRFNDADNCAFAVNEDQADVDSDGLGDACDPRDDRDFDGDGDFNLDDNCPFDANAEQEDGDGDGLGDACDPSDGRDVDGDGAVNADDNCPFDDNPDQADEDQDGIGDACDDADQLDPDNDELASGEDNCPFVGNADQADADGDGVGDACEVTVRVDGSGCSTGGGGASGWLVLAIAMLAISRRRR